MDLNVNHASISEIKSALEKAEVEFEKPEGQKARSTGDWRLMASEIQAEEQEKWAYSPKRGSPKRGSPKRASPQRGGSPRGRSPKRGSPKRPPRTPSSSEEAESSPEPEPRGRSPTRKSSPIRGNSRHSEKRAKGSKWTDWTRNWTSLPSWSWVALPVLLLLAYLAGFSRSLSGTPYCDATHFLDCKECPDFASCSGGRFTCFLGYTALGEKCISVSEHLELTQGHSLKILQLLRRQRGAFDCQETESPGLTRQEIGRALNVPSDDLAASFSRLREYGVMDTGTQLTTSEAEYSFGCQARSFFFDNVRIIVPALLVLALILYQLWLWVQDRKLRALIPHLHQLLQELAQEGKSMAVRNIEDEMGIHGAQWRRFSVLVLRDSRIGTTATLLHGRQTEAWQWVAPLRSPVKSPQSSQI